MNITQSQHPLLWPEVSNMTCIDLSADRAKETAVNEYYTKPSPSTVTLAEVSNMTCIDLSAHRAKETAVNWQINKRLLSTSWYDNTISYFYLRLDGENEKSEVGEDLKFYKFI